MGKVLFDILCVCEYFVQMWKSLENIIDMDWSERA